METDWTKHGAIAGYGGWALGAANIGVALWLGLRQQASASQPGPQSVSAVPGWIWLIASLYVVAIIVSGVFHYKGRHGAQQRTDTPSLRKEAESNTEIARLNEHRVGLLGTIADTSRRHQEELAAKQSIIDELRAGIDNAKRRANDICRVQREEIDHLTKQLAPIWEKESKERQLAAVLGKAPKLYIDFKPRDGSARGAERIVFSKEGEGSIRIKDVGPLVWAVNEVRQIALFNLVGTIRDAPVECKFTACRTDGNLTTNLYLPDLIRDMIGQHGIEAQPRIAVEYEDMEGRTYSRRFVLSIDPSDRIDWEPESLELVADAHAATAGVASLKDSNS